MITPYVCQRCSRWLLRPNGWLRNSSFVSLGKLVDHEAESKQQGQEEIVVNVEPAKPGKSHGRKRQSFAQQYQEQHKPAGVDKVLETLFSSTRTQEKVAQVSRYSRTPKEQSVDYSASDRSIDHRLLELHNQLHEGTARLEYIWASCQQLLGERNWKDHYEASEDDKRKANSIVFRDILLAICSEKRILVNDLVVTPAIVIELYRQQGAMRYWWDRVLWTQIGLILQLKHAGGDIKADFVSKDKIPAIVQDLLDVWSLFVERYQIYRSALYIEGNGRESTVSNPTVTEGLSHQNGINIFLGLLPKHPNNSQNESIIAAAMLTLDLLEAKNLPCPPLLEFFFRKIRDCGDLNIKVARFGLSEAGFDPEILSKALEKPRRFKYEKRLPWERDSLGERKSKKVLDWSQRSMASRLTDINRALNRKDAEEAINLWENYHEYLKTQQRDDKETSDCMFAHFLRTFWAIHRSDRAIDVWNYMISTGQIPGQIHWTAMLSGCVRARDIASMRQIWTNMVRSDLKPDINTWTTYIHGLVRLGQWQEGFQALESLGRTWKRPQATHRPNAPSLEQLPDALAPRVQPVHAALSALIDIQKPELTPMVIAWAESQNLRLETYTFNILLKPLVRTGTQAQIQSHLAQMAEHNCAPDIVTFTIILNGLVSNKDSNFHSLPSKAQESAITSILEDMEGKGLPANAHTYSTLLNGFLNGEAALKHFNDTNTTNVSAARTILAHMQKRNIFPSSHIYTILIIHYFASKPPDLPAISSLWASIAHSGQTANLDVVFYDRMIEGYADLDEIEKALQLLRCVPGDGKSPGWQALYRVLAALDRAGEWDMCNELMRDIEDPKEGLLKHGQGRTRGKLQFYKLVDGLRTKGVILGGKEQI